MKMFAAVEKSDFEIVESLLQAKASANFSDRESFTPLMYACAYGDLDIAKILVKSKADPAYTAADGSSSLICALGEGFLDVSQFLLSCPGVGVNNKANEMQPLFITVQEGKHVSAKFLLDQKADPNLSSMDNFVLYAAAGEGNVKIADLLVEYGADPNKGNLKTNATALFVAVQKLDKDMIRTLIQAKSNVDHENIHGLTPIQFAMSKDADVGILELLIKHTSCINRTYQLFPADMTPLLFAIDCDSPVCLCVCVCWGGDGEGGGDGWKGRISRHQVRTE